MASRWLPVLFSADIELILIYKSLVPSLSPFGETFGWWSLNACLRTSGPIMWLWEYRESVHTLSLWSVTLHTCSSLVLSSSLPFLFSIAPVLLSHSSASSLFSDLFHFSVFCDATPWLVAPGRELVLLWEPLLLLVCAVSWPQPFVTHSH